jgi:hypothetical protein
MQEVTQRQADEDTMRRLLNDLERLIFILTNRTDITDITDMTMWGLNAAQVVMSPRASRTVAVTAIIPPSATRLVENTVLNLMQVTFVNDDFAIPVYIGDADVVVPAGDLIDPRQRITYNLRRGQKKYGIVALGTANVIVSEGESALAAVTTDAFGREIVM